MKLFNLGSILATKPEDVHPQAGRESPLPKSRSSKREIDAMNEDLPPAPQFRAAPAEHGSMPIYTSPERSARRAERLLVALGAARESIPPEAIQYLNRLSDAMFVWKAAGRISYSTFPRYCGTPTKPPPPANQNSSLWGAFFPNGGRMKASETWSGRAYLSGAGFY